MSLPDIQHDPVSFTGKMLMAKDGSSILVNDAGEQLLLADEPSDEKVARGSMPHNSEWLRHSFIVGAGTVGASLSDQDQFNARYSDAMIKYTDASPGGNKHINPPPQFTRYADIRPPHALNDAAPVTLQAPQNHMSYGMGRYYSESIDDNSQVIHLRFGVASFNSLTQFFTGFYSGHLAAAARAARYTDDFVRVWTTRIGNVIGLAIAPLFIIPAAIILAGQIVRYFMNWPSSKFYTLKPAMPMYWMAVSNIVNQMAVNSGLSSYVDSNAAKKILKGGQGVQDLQTSQIMNFMGQFLPRGILRPNGTLDIYAIANRSNRLEVQYQNKLAKAFENASSSDSWFDIVRKHVNQSGNSNAALDGTTNFEVKFQNLPTTLEEYFQRFVNFVSYNKDDKSSSEKDPRSKGFDDATNKYDSSKVDDPGFWDYFTANLNDGSEWVSYRVDYTGQVREDFSSSTAESGLATKINSMSRAAREARFNVADGNLGGGIGAVTDAVKGVVSGIAEVVHIEGLAALAGSAFVDIPQMWNESMSSLPKTNYSVTLISPYGNPVSLLLNIWMPLATLIAGALPLATGKQSHTSPFLVELHDRGRCMTRLGIIESMSIARGTSNVGFNREGQALAIEVSFSIRDLSGIIAMPINQGFDILNPLEGLFDGDNSFSDYLMTLSSMKLADTIYRVPMLKYQINRKVADMSTFFSTAHVASYIASIPSVNLLGAAMKGTDKK
jgi:hypothetical protein